MTAVYQIEMPTGRLKGEEEEEEEIEEKEEEEEAKGGGHEVNPFNSTYINFFLIQF